MNLNPSKPTDVYLVLHKSARYPADLFYEYMVGELRGNLQNQRYGRPLTDQAYRQAKQAGEMLKDRGIAEIVTDGFITPLETARVIAKEIGNPGIATDSGIAESDLSYLTKEGLSGLEQKSGDDPFVYTRDWYMQASQEEKDRLYDGHIKVWDLAMKRNDGYPFLLVLHVEGMQFYVNELLGRERDDMINLHFRKGNYVLAHLSPSEKPLLSF